MSRTTVIHLTLGKRSEEGMELRNSWGAAPIIWNDMGKKFLHLGDNEYTREIEKLWPLWKDLSIPQAYRAVLMLTYDKYYVAKKNYARMAKDIRVYLSECPPDYSHVNHWPALAEMFESDPDVEGIGLWCTSVSENLFEGEYNEETEEYGPLDWSTIDEIYEDLDSIKQH